MTIWATLLQPVIQSRFEYARRKHPTEGTSREGENRLILEFSWHMIAPPLLEHRMTFMAKEVLSDISYCILHHSFVSNAICRLCLRLLRCIANFSIRMLQNLNRYVVFLSIV